VGAIIVFVIFGGFGLVMLYVGVTQHLEQKRLLANARPVEVEITRSEVKASTSKGTEGSPGRGTTSYAPEVEFRYRVGGVEYTSDRIYPTIISRGYASHDGAAELIRPFRAGTRVKAFVDQTRPEKAFLIAEAGAGPMVFMIVGVLLPPVAWLAGRLI
jgi:hypothetical protein